MKKWPLLLMTVLVLVFSVSTSLASYDWVRPAGEAITYIGNWTLVYGNTSINNCSVTHSCSEVVYGADENRVVVSYVNISDLPVCVGTDKLTYNGSLLYCQDDLVGNGTMNDTSIMNCSVDDSCDLITYDSETVGWDKNGNDDFSGAYADLTGTPTALSDFTDDINAGNDNLNLSESCVRDTLSNASMCFIDGAVVIIA